MLTPVGDALIKYAGFFVNDECSRTPWRGRLGGSGRRVASGSVLAALRLCSEGEVGRRRRMACPVSSVGGHPRHRFECACPSPKHIREPSVCARSRLV
jgi:hypothetical protein